MSRNEESSMERQWRILKLLPLRGSGITVSQLVNLYKNDTGCDASTATANSASFKRKIQRDLEILHGIGLVEKNDKGKPYGWRLANKSSFLASQTPTEALFLSLAHKAIQPIVPQTLLEPLTPVFEQAYELIERGKKARLGLSQKLIISKTSPLISAKLSETVLEQVYQALEGNKVLSIKYRRPLSVDYKEHKVNPYGLLQRSPSVYLLGSISPHRDILKFALHRIESAHVTTLSAEIDEVDLRQLEQVGDLCFGGRELIPLKIRTSKKLAGILSETPLSDDQTFVQDKEDAYIITASVKDSWELQYWLLSQGKQVEILEPIELRHRIQKELIETLDGYANQICFPADSENGDLRSKSAS